ncbi:hypothetical protein ACS0TY_035605 [Phlomoides rotata]
MSPEKMQASSVISLSPSFNIYSNSKIAEIAARVVEEFDSEEFYDDFYIEREDDLEYVKTEKENSVVPEEDLNDDEEEEFEFPLVNRETEFYSPISADDIFHNGQIRPVYPVFNRDLLLDRVEFQQKNVKEEKPVLNSDSENAPTIRLPLRKLFIEERETTMTRTSSCSSSEADDLDGVPAESYCVWRPKEAAEGQCKKSSSAGSNSKRWKFKDLLHRSHSDGSKGNFVFLSPSNSGTKKQSEEAGKETPVRGGKAKSAAAPPLPPKRVHDRDGGEKRRSFLPYKQDLVGLFTNVNGLSKNLQPF